MGVNAEIKIDTMLITSPGKVISNAGYNLRCAIYMAIGNVLATGILALTANGAFLYTTIAMWWQLVYKKEVPSQTWPIDKFINNKQDLKTIATCAMILFHVIYLSSSFAFSVMLYNGLTTKKPNLIQAFLMFAIVGVILFSVFEILETIKALKLNAKDGLREDIAIGFMVIILYTEMIHKVYKAYKIIVHEKVQSIPTVYMGNGEIRH